MQFQYPFVSEEVFDEILGDKAEKPFKCCLDWLAFNCETLARTDPENTSGPRRMPSGTYKRLKQSVKFAKQRATHGGENVCQLIIILLITINFSFF